MSDWIAVPLVGKRGRGMFALVDREDAHLVAGHLWHLSYPYASTSMRRPDGKRGPVAMHRVILDAQPGQYVDHINANGLDNRRSNLRLCTNSQNLANARTGGPDYYRGISFYGKKWVAKCAHGSRRLVGDAPTAEEAARLYDRFARELHGEFARLNFPEAGERGVFDVGAPIDARQQRQRMRAA
jgi:hypothetical protein